MRTKFTPGPWKNHGTHLETSTGDLVVAPGAGDAEIRANSALISAAPELAEAGREMLRAFGNCGTPREQAAADALANALRKAGIDPWALL